MTFGRLDGDTWVQYLMSCCVKHQISGMLFCHLSGSLSGQAWDKTALISASSWHRSFHYLSLMTFYRVIIQGNGTYIDLVVCPE